MCAEIIVRVSFSPWTYQPLCGRRQGQFRCLLARLVPSGSERAGLRVRSLEMFVQSVCCADLSLLPERKAAPGGPCFRAHRLPRQLVTCPGPPTSGLCADCPACWEGCPAHSSRSSVQITSSESPSLTVFGAHSPPVLWPQSLSAGSCCAHHQQVVFFSSHSLFRSLSPSLCGPREDRGLVLEGSLW